MIRLDEQPESQAATHAKAVSTLAAKLALVGIELHVVTKAGNSFYEVRRKGEAFAVSTLHSVAGIVARTQSAWPTEVA